MTRLSHALACCSLAWAQAGFGAAGADLGAPASLPAVVDDEGHRIVLPAPAVRVVSLAPHLTELVHAAGGGSRLVGVGLHSDHPPEAARLPVVGDAFAVNLEAIAALQPDLILIWQSGTAPRQVKRLRTLQRPIFVSEIADVEGIADTLKRIGQLLGTQATADAAATRLLARWQDLQVRHAKQAPVRVFVQLWGQPLMTVNRRHLIDAAVRTCGGRNPFADLPALTPTIGWDAALRADPQVVIVADTQLVEAHRLWSRFPGVSAVRHRLVLGLPADRLTRMGPRFVDAAEELCAVLQRARSLQAKPEPTRR